MRVLTTSGLYANGSAEQILLKFASRLEAGQTIHDERVFFLPEAERGTRHLTRQAAEVVAMSAEDVLRDMEDAGHLLIMPEQRTLS